jgi:excisionase family DNA binding protein
VNSPLWTLKETARFLGVHPKTLERWVRSRRIPCVRVGTRIRFDPSDVVAWVSARKEG